MTSAVGAAAAWPLADGGHLGVREATLPAQRRDRRAGAHPGGGADGHPPTPGQAAKTAASTEPPLHVHHREDEPWYILDYKMTFHIADEILEATAGCFAFAPRRTPHTFTV